MGNYRFRLSDMMPNAWFYKLKDMNKSRNQQKIMYHSHISKKKPQHTSNSSFSSSSSSSFSSSLSCKERQHRHRHKHQQQGQLSDQRKSYYFSRDLSTAAVPGGAENAETKTRILLNGNDGVESGRKSSMKRRSTRRNRGITSSSSVVAAAGGCSCRTTVESVWNKPDSTTPEEYPNSPLDTSSENEEASIPTNYSPENLGTTLSWSSSRPYCRDKLQDKDIIMDIGNKTKEFQEPVAAGDKNDGFHTVSQMNLPPIITNRKKIESLQSREPAKAKVSENNLEERNVCGSGSCAGSGSGSGSASVKEQKNKKKNKVINPTPPLARRISANSSQGVKLRTNSPRIMNKGRKSVSISSNISKSRRSISESFAVVKSSKDPQKDFRDSMVEMIIENNLCASKDLEDLLACYLSLNSDEYHDLIISVFKQIWFDITDIPIPK